MIIHCIYDYFNSLIRALMNGVSRVYGGDEYSTHMIEYGPRESLDEGQR